MPVYEYQCAKCKTEFEVMQKITEEPLLECSACGGELKKLITNTSFVLKGSGWYVTDYPSADRKKALDSKKPAAADKDKKSKDTKADTKTNNKKAVNA
jgi:putative FmdB family regulatory protein